MKSINKLRVLTVMLAFVALTACSYRPEPAAPAPDATPAPELVFAARMIAPSTTPEVLEVLESSEADNSGIVDDPELIAEVETPTVPWADFELQAIAQTLAGECYEDKAQDKRRVCEVILNRLSDGSFGDTILEVLTKPGAFNGYWRQSRPISENDYDIAEQALRDWYDGGCEPLSEWLYFSSGPNRENVFRATF